MNSKNKFTSMLCENHGNIEKIKAYTVYHGILIKLYDFLKRSDH